MKKMSFLKRIIVRLIKMVGKEFACELCEDYNQDKGVFCYKDEGRTKEMLSYPQVIEMLQVYDEHCIVPFEKAMGYEDARINTFDFVQFKKYLGHVENLSKKAGIAMTGISFISVGKLHADDGREYSSLIYMPSTTVGGAQVLYDPVQSYRSKALVTFGEMLAKHGYQWIYDTKETYKKGKRKDNKYQLPVMMKATNSLRDGNDFEESGAANLSHLTPPYA
jgi:hypothetical protein